MHTASPTTLGSYPVIELPTFHCAFLFSRPKSTLKNNDNKAVTQLPQRYQKQNGLMVPLVSPFQRSFQRFPKLSSIHATSSNPALVPPTGNLERNLREQKLFFRTFYSNEGSRHVSDVKRDPIHTLHQDFQSLDGKGPPPSPASCAHLKPAALNSCIETESHIRSCIRRTVGQKKATSTRENHSKISRKLSKTPSWIFSSPGLSK